MAMTMSAKYLVQKRKCVKLLKATSPISFQIWCLKYAVLYAAPIMKARFPLALIIGFAEAAMNVEIFTSMTELIYKS